MSDYVKPPYSEQQAIKHEAKYLADLVSRGLVDPADKNSFPAQLSQYTQSLIKDANVTGKLGQLKEYLHESLPSDFPVYTDKDDKQHFADLSKVEGTVNLIFSAIKNRHGQALDFWRLEQVNIDLFNMQKVHQDKIPVDASVSEIQNLLSNAFVTDFERRAKGSTELSRYEAYLLDGRAQLRIRR
ncbi:hypothetical protein BH10CYA1_BH10CYA1_64410 [soil metagenome]